MIKQYQDKKWLEDKYINEKLSSCKIANLCDVTTSKIMYSLKKHNIPIRSIGEAQTKIGNINKKWLEDKYCNDKLNLAKIGRFCGVNKTTIYKWLKKFNIPIRSNSESHKGITLSEEGKRNLSESLKGIKRSNKSRLKYSESKRGIKNPSWKGGLCPLFKSLRRSFKYRQWRSDVFTRDDFTCQECGEKGCYIEAHHIKSFSSIIQYYEITTFEEALNCEELWNINNGITYCKKFHKRLHKEVIINGNFGKSN